MSLSQDLQDGDLFYFVSKPDQVYIRNRGVLDLLTSEQATYLSELSRGCRLQTLRTMRLSDAYEGKGDGKLDVCIRCHHPIYTSHDYIDCSPTTDSSMHAGVCPVFSENNSTQGVKDYA